MTDEQVRQIAIAIYTVNRHAKTAPDNKHLYYLKKAAIDQLIQSGKAKKIGLHFSDNTKYSQQHSTTLVKCQDFLFHTLSEKEDFKTLPHLGQQNHTSRNPRERMNLRTARNILQNYIGYVSPKAGQKKKSERPKKNHRKPSATGFRSSYLDG